MIICHPLKLIFFKTKNTAGTPFEIALSRFCGPTCIITPTGETDEALHQSRCGVTAQNHQMQNWPDGSDTQTEFSDHMTAAEVRRVIPADIWSSYRKVTIVRNPFDTAYSRYWSEGGDQIGLDFGAFCYLQRFYLSENSVIAPVAGANTMDLYLRFEHLEDDVTQLGLDGFGDDFTALRAQSGHSNSDGTTIEEAYKQFPIAGDVVARECADVIEKFDYRRPRNIAVPDLAGQQDKAPIIFTLTAGRTATAWFSKFLSENQGVPALHEPLGHDDFSQRMPDISTMRMFNTFGFTREVRAFWEQKLGSIQGAYAETNHVLGKCGLIEALADSHLRDRATVIILRRNLAEQCASYLARGDFNNVTLEWQWYLSPAYRNVIVHPDPFLSLGPVGRAVWYCYEMEARQAYYLLKYQDRIRFVELQMEDIVQPEYAAEFLRLFDHEGELRMPEKANATSSGDAAHAQLKAEVKQLIQGIAFDPVQIAEAYIRKGRDLGQPAPLGAAA